MSTVLVTIDRNTDLMTSSTLTLRDSYEVLPSLRPAWERLEHHPNSAYEHFEFVCRHLPQVVSPMVIAIQEANQTKLILAGRLEKTKLCPRLGYLRLPAFPVRVWTVVHEGLLGEIDPADARIIACHFLDVLQRGHCDAIQIRALKRSHAALWTELGQWPYVGVGHKRPRWSKHYSLRLPAEPDILLRKMRSKHRTWLQGRRKKLEETFPQAVRWAWFGPGADLDILCKDAENVARTTYQRRLGAGFMDNEFTRAKLAFLARKKMVRFAMLYVNKEPKAFWQGTIFGQTFYSAATGYTSEMQPFEVGTLLFLWMVNRLVEEGVRRLDFGLGEAPYKERFSSEHWESADIILFGPTIRSRLRGIYYAAFQQLNLQVESLLRRVALDQKVKRWWRDWMSKSH